MKRRMTVLGLCLALAISLLPVSVLASGSTTNAAAAGEPEKTEESLRLDPGSMEPETSGVQISAENENKEEEEENEEKDNPTDNAEWDPAGGEGEEEPPEEQSGSNGGASPVLLSAPAPENLTTNHRQTARWILDSDTYTEFYVTAYDQDSGEELSFSLSYSVTWEEDEFSFEIADLVRAADGFSSETTDYGFSYATVYGVDYEDNSQKDNPEAWKTLGSRENPVTSLRIVKDKPETQKWALWKYTAFSGETELGEIDVRAHNDSEYPYLYVQLWCTPEEPAAKNESTGKEYTSLDRALGEAGEGDTILLLRDVEALVSSSERYSIDRGLTLDLGGHTIAVRGGSTDSGLFRIRTDAPVTLKNGVMDGGTPGAEGSAVRGEGSSGALACVTLEDLTIQNFGAAQYGIVYLYDGNLTASGCQFRDNGSSAVTMRSSAGDSALYDGTFLVMDSCTVSGNVNSTHNYGGGIGVRQISRVSVNGCTITGNELRSTPDGVYGGGGMILYNVGEITLTDNIIQGNSSSLYGGGVLILSGSAFTQGDRTILRGNTIAGNDAVLNGGGLTYYINPEQHENETYCIFEENHIDGNRSEYRGGGMSLYSNDASVEFQLRSGTVCDNTAQDWGGGIDFAFERPAVLRLYRALITENSAWRGGGVWLCPTSQLTMHVTFGGAITGNDALCSAEGWACGDEIRFEGDEEGDSGTGTVVSVASRALGGTLMEWYTDEAEARYRDGLGARIDVTAEEYRDRTESFSLHGNLSESGIALAEAEAAVLISGNTAVNGYGGGICSNAGLVFGEDGDKEVLVHKEWIDADGQEMTGDLPADSVDVTLIRISEDGTETDLETVTLSEENQWSWAFQELPADDTYRVREETDLGDYAPTYEIQSDGDGSTVRITITNGLIREPKLSKETQEDDYQRKEEDGGSLHEGKDTGGDGWGAWDDADNLQEVTFRLTLTDLLGSGSLTVHDDLEEGLYFTHEVEVVLQDGDTSVKLTAGRDYTLTEGDCSDPGGCRMKGCTFEVRLEDSVLEGLSSEACLIITYRALTETHPEEYENYQDGIRNDSYLTCLRGGTFFRTEVVSTETDLFGFGIYKYAGSGGTQAPLEGAGFLLSRETGEGTAYGVFARETGDGRTYYMETGWVSNPGDATVLGSGEDGWIRILGLDDDTYTLTETEAPAGYRKPAGPVTVCIDENGELAFLGTGVSSGEDSSHEIRIRNFRETPAAPETEPETVSVQGSKIWVGDEESTRPESILIRLSADGELTETRTVTADQDWSWTFSGLPKYDESGKEIVYTVWEDPVPGYSSESSGYDIINTWTGESEDRTDLSVTKIWEDGEDADGIRPEFVAVELVRNGIPTGRTLILDENNGWSGAFPDLEKETDGVKNEWSVTEHAVEGYEGTVSGNEESGFVITNSHIPERTEEPESPEEPENPAGPDIPDSPAEPSAPKDPDPPEEGPPSGKPEFPNDPDPSGSESEEPVLPQTGAVGHLAVLALILGGGGLLLVGIGGLLSGVPERRRKK